MLLYLKIFKNLPNMKWYFRYLFYIFGAVLSLIVLGLIGALVDSKNTMVGYVFLIFIILMIVKIEYKTLKAESNENGQK